ncbi:MAG TPA: NAD(P)/FAD-dependent oxidoreductase, partial [Gammaproteobacteria bacterium]
MSNKKITIIGTGFAAITAVRQLRKHSAEAEITVISPRAEFVFLPSLIWIPSRIRTPEQLSVPLENFFRRMRVDFIQAEVTGLKD